MLKLLSRVPSPPYDLVSSSPAVLTWSTFVRQVLLDQRHCVPLISFVRDSVAPPCEDSAQHLDLLFVDIHTVPHQTSLARTIPCASTASRNHRLLQPQVSHQLSIPHRTDSLPSRCTPSLLDQRCCDSFVVELCSLSIFMIRKSTLSLPVCCASDPQLRSSISCWSRCRRRSVHETCTHRPH